MDAEVALQRLKECGVPIESLALYGRWWQLEVWLRQLAYLVLRSAWGVTWETELHKKATSYSANDDLGHLVGPDQPDLLGYLDFSLLLALLEDNWGFFEPFLLKHIVWAGRAAEMRAIRNRVGHVRRTGSHDRGRVEQLLSDLEPGYRTALGTLASSPLNGRWASDPVVADYTKGTLGAACEHLRRKYRFDVDLSVSQMPWAQLPSASLNLSNTPGILWHLEIGGPDRFVHPGRLASTIQPVRDHVVYVFAGTYFGAQLSVPAVDDSKDVLKTLTFFVQQFGSCTVAVDRISKEELQAWPRLSADLDSRVLVEHLFATAPSAATPGSIFGV